MEPTRVAIVWTAGSSTEINVDLVDYSTSTTIYSANVGTLKANNSGIISFVLQGGNPQWNTILPTVINSNVVLNVKTGPSQTLFAQYRLDELMIIQAQTGTGVAQVSGAGAFVEDTANNIVYYNKTDADLVFGDNNTTWTSGTESKLFLDKSKGALRAGAVTNTNWDDSEVGFYSTALGYNTIAKGGTSTAIGNLTTANGANSTSMGYQTIADGLNSFAVGEKDTASGISSVAMGSASHASGYVSTAIGELNSSTNDYSVALGYKNKSNGNASFVSGYESEASGSSAIAMGYQTKANGNYGFAAGRETSAAGYAGFAVGDKDSAIGNYSFALGLKSVASGATSTAIGFNTRATGDVSFSLGSQSLASGYSSFAMGESDTASASRSIAIGSLSKATANYGVAIGRETIATGTQSLAMGYQTEAIGNTSTALGYNTFANGDYSLAIGMFNNTASSDELLTIGNGTSTSTRSNALEVHKNGTVILGDDGSAQHYVRGIMTVYQGLNANGSESSVAVHFSATAPINPITGSIWYDTGASALKIWNGSTWLSI